MIVFKLIEGVGKLIFYILMMLLGIVFLYCLSPVLTLALGIIILIGVAVELCWRKFVLGKSSSSDQPSYQKNESQF